MARHADLTRCHSLSYLSNICPMSDHTIYVQPNICPIFVQCLTMQYLFSPISVQYPTIQYLSYGSSVHMQRLMMRVQLIPYVMPLLFNYDASAERPEDVEEGAASRDTEQTMGPKFLGLAVVRTNMQVRSSTSRRMCRRLWCNTICRNALCIPCWYPRMHHMYGNQPTGARSFPSGTAMLRWC
jgi:hypothetical protein